MFGFEESGSGAAVASNTAKFSESTCCIIKPHAVKTGNKPWASYKLAN